MVCRAPHFDGRDPDHHLSLNPFQPIPTSISQDKAMLRSRVTRSILALGSLAAVAGCQPGERGDNREADRDDTAEESAEVTADDRDRDQQRDRDAERSDREAPATASGTFRASGGYQSPNGPETIDVSITITDGVIEAVEVIPGATNSTSKRYQGDFAGGIAAEVVGKSLAEADVTRVAGSSLTSGGFAEALQTIRQDAKVG